MLLYIWNIILIWSKKGNIYTWVALHDRKSLCKMEAVLWLSKENRIRNLGLNQNRWLFVSFDSGLVMKKNKLQIKERKLVIEDNLISVHRRVLLFSFSVSELFEFHNALSKWKFKSLTKMGMNAFATDHSLISNPTQSSSEFFNYDRLYLILV